MKEETKRKKEHEVIISLASNEQAETHLAKARELLKMLIHDLVFTQEKWTEPVHTIRKSPYLNQLCKGTTELGPNLLSEVLKETERRLGRTHNEDGIVVIDLDLMQYDDQRHHLRDWDRDYIKNLINEL